MTNIRADQIENGILMVEIPVLDTSAADDSHVFLHIRLLESIKAQAELAITRAKDHLSTKYNDQLKELLAKKPEPYGSVSLEVKEGYFLEYTISKKVDWDQEFLNDKTVELSEQGEEISEYIDTEYNVPESRYKAWPSSLQKMFEDGRTVSGSKPSLKIKVKAE